MNTLSPDIILTVFSYLSVKELGNIASVCKTWKTMSETPCLWKYHLSKDLGITTHDSSVSYKKRYQIRTLTVHGLEKLDYRVERIYFETLSARNLLYIDWNEQKKQMMAIHTHALFIFDNETNKPKEIISHIPSTVFEENHVVSDSHRCLNCQQDLANLSRFTSSHVLFDQSEKKTQIQAIYDLTRSAFTVACQGEILYAQDQIVVFLETTGHLKVKDVNQNKIIFSYKIKLDQLFGAVQHGASLIDNFLLLASADNQLIGIDLAKETLTFRYPLESGKKIYGVKLLNKDRFLVQTKKNETMLFTTQGNVIKTLPYSLYFNHNPNDQKKQPIQANQQKFIAYDLTTSQASVHIFDNQTGDLEYTWILPNKNFTYLTHNRMITFSNQGESELNLYDLITHKRINSYSFSRGKIELNPTDLQDLQFENLLYLKIIASSHPVESHVFLDLLNGRVISPHTEITDGLSQIWQIKNGRFVFLSKIKWGYKLTYHQFTQSEASLTNKVWNYWLKFKSSWEL